MRTIKFILRLFYDAYNEWSHDRAARLGAALAYYALFSLAPLAIIMINIAGAVYGEAAAQGQIVHAMSRQIGPEAAANVERFLADIYYAGTHLFPTIITIIFLIYGATNFFSELRDALNTMWHVRPKPREHFLGSVVEIAWDRFLAAVMVLSISVGLLAALSISTSLTLLNGWLSTIIRPETSGLMKAGNIISGFGLITLFFALAFKILPDVKISWRVIAVGSFVTSILFNIGAFVTGLYLGYSSFQSVLGAASSLLVLMIWVAYSAQIIFFGAKFTLVYASAIGDPILPSSNAVSMKLSSSDNSRTEQ
jgi:membrane protein